MSEIFTSFFKNTWIIGPIEYWVLIEMAFTRQVKWEKKKKWKKEKEKTNTNIPPDVSEMRTEK